MKTGKPNKTLILRHALLAAASFGCSAAYAIPTIQVGAPAGPSDSGIYADYVVSSSDPEETDTAITSGGVLYVAGAYQNNPELLIGGQYNANALAGLDWSQYTFSKNGSPFFPSVFDDHGAILIASLPQGSIVSDGVGGYVLASGVNLLVDGLAPFYLDPDTSYVRTASGQTHDPVKPGTSDFAFFDLGDFDRLPDAVTNMAEEDGSSADGETKILSLIIGGVDWVHFDAMALVTDVQGSKLVTSWDINAFSKDVTWKTPAPDPGPPLPAPGPLALIGIGSFALGLVRRRRKV